MEAGRQNKKKSPTILTCPVSGRKSEDQEAQVLVPGHVGCWGHWTNLSLSLDLPFSSDWIDYGLKSSEPTRLLFQNVLPTLTPQTPPPPPTPATQRLLASQAGCVWGGSFCDPGVLLGSPSYTTVTSQSPFLEGG